jgi:hypothetical protein
VTPGPTAGPANRGYPKAKALADAARLLSQRPSALSVPPGVFIAEIDRIDAADRLELAVARRGLVPPLLVRSCATNEDREGALSGMLASHRLDDLSGLSMVLESMVVEAADVAAGTPGAIVQEFLEVDRGVVGGFEVCAGKVIEARLEVASGLVPVEEPACTILEFETVVDAAGCVFVAGTADDELLRLADAAFAMAVAAVEDGDRTAGFVEMELAVVADGTFALLQLRIDDVGARLVTPRTEQNFGADRNYPLPVGHLTGTLVAPVFSETFGARVRMDDTRQLVTDAARLPTPHLANAARRCGAGRPLTIDHFASAESWHATWWDRLLRQRDTLASAPVERRFADASAHARDHLRTYFTNPLWLHCLDVAWHHAPIPQDLVEQLSPSLRSYRSATVHWALRSGHDLSAIRVDDIVDVALVGDDDVLTLSLIEDLASMDASRRILADHFSTTAERILEAALARRDLTAEASSLIDRLRADGDLDPRLDSLVLAHWYQESDNRFKEVAYLAVREAAAAVAYARGLHPDDLVLLTVDEVEDLATGTLRCEDAAALAASRQSVPVAVPAVPSASSGINVLKGTLDRLPTLAVVVGSDGTTPAEGAPRLVWAPTLSALGVRQLPDVEIVVVGHLGVLSHAANGLRALPDIRLALSGWHPQTPPKPGTRVLVDAVDGQIILRGEP